MKNKVRRKKKINKKIKKDLPFLFYGLLLCAFSLSLVASFKYIKNDKINPNNNVDTNEIKNAEKIKIIIVITM